MRSYYGGLFLFFALIIIFPHGSTSSASFRILSSNKEIACNGSSCTYCTSGRHQKINSLQPIRKKREEAAMNKCRDWKKSDQITLELGVFADHALYQEFHRRYPTNSTQLKIKMQEFILSIVQQGKEIFLSPTLKPKVNIDVVEYKVILHKFRRFSLRKVRQDMPSYMDSFCRYQRQLNIPKRWDHAVLFTGFDLIHSIHQGNFAGYSSSSSVCGPMSCSLVEASSFKSAYTLAHEIGHSLGMMHDNGSDACPSNNVMSPIIFSGSQNWSACSVGEFQQYLESIPCNKWCLDAPQSNNVSKSTKVSAMPAMPGQSYSAFDQCRHYFGFCSKPYIIDSEHQETICAELWCNFHDGTMRLAHAALEGTYCGEGKWCRFGKCIAINDQMTIAKRNGQWSSWSPLPTDDSCGYSACSKRQIVNQLSIQRQIRSCSNPSPNNGGLDCDGEMYRGIVCNDESESENLIEENEVSENTVLQTIEEYATKICTNHKRRAELENDTFVALSGDGFQRAIYDLEPNICYVWCSTVNATFTSYTFFDAFPDGTFCGKNRFCVSGKCMDRQRCNATLTYITTEIPSECEKNITSKLNKTLSKVTVYSAWSSWGECSKTCGIGVKRRIRLCSPTNATACSKLANTHQYQFCRGSTNKCNSEIEPISKTSTRANQIIEDNDVEGSEKLPEDEKDELEIEQQNEIRDNNRETLTETTSVTVTTKFTTTLATTKMLTTKIIPTKMITKSKSTTKIIPMTKRHTPTSKTTLSTTTQRSTTITTTPTVVYANGNGGRWSEWSNWGECNARCNGVQKGSRTCLSGTSCRGPETKKRLCNVKQKCLEP